MKLASKQQEFQQLVEDHKKILYKICRLYCANPADREDLAQEILAQLWRSFPRFDGRCLFSTWMYRVALNTAISFVRIESTRRQHITSDNIALLNFTADQPQESEEIRLMYQLIAEMEPLPRALVLLFLDGNSYEEIAGILGLTVTNVATRLNRLKTNLKQSAAATQQR